MRSTEATQTDQVPTASGTVRASNRPKLSPHVKLRHDRQRQQHVILGPESVCVLNATGAAILALCDGQRTVDAIAQELREQFDYVAIGEVLGFLARLVTKRYVELGDD